MDPPAADIRDPYYLRNFHRLADTVLARDGLLFTAEERARLETVRALPDHARRLLLRLVSRREGWLRRSRLAYAEIPALDEALAILERTDWLERWPQADLPEATPPRDLVATLHHDECRHLLRMAGLRPGGLALRDRERLANLFAPAGPGLARHDRQLDFWPDGGSLSRRLGSLDQWIRLRHRLLFQLLELLFFGNRHQDLSQFIVAEMGLQRFERVRPDAVGLFSDRAEAEALLRNGERLNRLREDLDDLRRHLKGWRRGRRLTPILARRSRDLLAEAWRMADPDQLLDGTLPPLLGGAGQRRRIRLAALLEGASLLERLGRPGAAAGWQRLALEAGVEGRRRGETWQRLSINLRHSGRAESAVAVCWQGLAEPLGPVTRHELARRAGERDSLREAPLRACQAIRHPGHRGGRILLQGTGGAALDVEEWALEHFRAEGWQGLHAENLLLKALVGLAAWDLVFAPVPGAFLHRYQAAPLDWGRPGFLERRAEAWRRLGLRLRRERHRAGVRERLRSKAGLENPLVAWSVLIEPGISAQAHSSPVAWRRGLEVLLAALPGPLLAQFAQRLLEHPAECGHGLPDLLLWREDTSGVLRDWRLVEVKGPGDRLSLAQQLWLDWLLARGLPVELLMIECGQSGG
ncbi:MAG: VRR-NUC domain-containing protein [bacterium]|jgi:hypothetical protein|nr:VRR-NUC domain-containing protein [bacterium]